MNDYSPSSYLVNAMLARKQREEADRRRQFQKEQSWTALGQGVLGGVAQAGIGLATKYAGDYTDTAVEQRAASEQQRAESRQAVSDKVYAAKLLKRKDDDALTARDIAAGVQQPDDTGLINPTADMRRARGLTGQAIPDPPRRTAMLPTVTPAAPTTPQRSPFWPPDMDLPTTPPAATPPAGPSVFNRLKSTVAPAATARPSQPPEPIPAPPPASAPSARTTYYDAPDWGPGDEGKRLQRLASEVETAKAVVAAKARADEIKLAQGWTGLVGTQDQRNTIKGAGRGAGSASVSGNPIGLDLAEIQRGGPGLANRVLKATPLPELPAVANGRMGGGGSGAGPAADWWPWWLETGTGEKRKAPMGQINAAAETPEERLAVQQFTADAKAGRQSDPKIRALALGVAKKAGAITVRMGEPSKTVAQGVQKDMAAYRNELKLKTEPALQTERARIALELYEAKETGDFQREALARRDEAELKDVLAERANLRRPGPVGSVNKEGDPDDQTTTVTRTAATPLTAPLALPPPPAAPGAPPPTSSGADPAAAKRVELHAKVKGMTGLSPAQKDAMYEQLARAAGITP